MKYVLVICFALLSVCLLGQDAKAILMQSYERCQSVRSGYYEMMHSQKYMSGPDTSSTAFNCHFKKLKDDTLYSSAFHYQSFGEDQYYGDVMYTGDAFVNFNAEDSTGRIMLKSLWADKISDFSHNYTFYDPLTSGKSHPLPEEEDFDDDDHTFVYVGQEKVNGYATDHIRVDVQPENDTADMFQVVRIEYHFWIHQEDDIPVQYTAAFDIAMNGDTMYQYELIELLKYDLEYPEVDKHLTLESIPEYVVLKDYVPYKSPELLPADTIAPDWKLVSLTDDSLSLSELRGNLVVIDFFYKACFPCMQALPALQDLHERYADQGLKMIGIDPYDTKEEDQIDEFLAKRGVTYTVLLGGKETAKEYHVSGYPTLYIVGKDGKIVFTQVGYGKGTEVELEEVIKANL